MRFLRRYSTKFSQYFPTLDCPDRAALINRIQSNLLEKNIVTLSKIQEEMIPRLLDPNYKTALFTSQTGTGKTLGYLLPIILKFITMKPSKQDTPDKSPPSVFILVPSKDLANQVINMTNTIFGKSDLFSIRYFPPSKSIPANIYKMPKIAVSQFDDFFKYLSVGRKIHQHTAHKLMTNAQTVVIDEADIFVANPEYVKLMKYILQPKKSPDSLQFLFVAGTMPEPRGPKAKTPKNILRQIFRHYRCYDDGKVNQIPAKEYFIRTHPECVVKDDFVLDDRGDKIISKRSKKGSNSDKYKLGSDNDKYRKEIKSAAPDALEVFDVKAAGLLQMIKTRIEEIENDEKCNILNLLRQKHLNPTTEKISQDQVIVEKWLVFTNSARTTQLLLDIVFTQRPSKEPKKEFHWCIERLSNPISVSEGTSRIVKEHNYREELLARYCTFNQNPPVVLDSMYANEPSTQDARLMRKNVVTSDLLRITGSNLTSSNTRKHFIQILLATDSLSRGIDFHNVDVVVQFEFANTAQTYIHRAGRTARAGREGSVVSFIDPSDETLAKYVEAASNAEGEEKIPLTALISRNRSFAKNERRRIERRLGDRKGKLMEMPYDKRHN